MSAPIATKLAPTDLIDHKLHAETDPNIVRARCPSVATVLPPKVLVRGRLNLFSVLLRVLLPTLPLKHPFALLVNLLETVNLVRTPVFPLVED